MNSDTVEYEIVFVIFFLFLLSLINSKNVTTANIYFIYSNLSEESQTATL